MKTLAQFRELLQTLHLQLVVVTKEELPNLFERRDQRRCLGERRVFGLPDFIKERNRLELATAAQRAADRDGFGKEWAEAIRAGSTPGKKGYVAAMTLVHQAATGSDINAAAAAAADHFGIDSESVLRAVRRYKKKT